MPLIEVSWFFLFVWFSTPGTTLLDKIPFPFGGGEVWFHIFSHFYWVHYNLSTEITQGNLLTLYRPKSPRSRSTFRALTLGPVVISPATCRRILTISRGLVKMTWEPPACRQERRDRADFQISPTGSTGKKNPEMPPHCTTLRFPLHGGNESPMLWPMLEGLTGMARNSVSSFVSIWNVKSVSQSSLSRVNPAICKMAKLINSFGKQKWSQMWQHESQWKGKRW